VGKHVFNRDVSDMREPRYLNRNQKAREANKHFKIYQDFKSDYLVLHGLQLSVLDVDESVRQHEHMTQKLAVVALFLISTRIPDCVFRIFAPFPKNSECMVYTSEIDCQCKLMILEKPHKSLLCLNLFAEFPDCRRSLVHPRLLP
jgi:hypothetical protein